MDALTHDGSIQKLADNVDFAKSLPYTKLGIRVSTLSYWFLFKVNCQRYYQAESIPVNFSCKQPKMRMLVSDWL